MRERIPPTAGAQALERRRQIASTVVSGIVVPGALRCPHCHEHLEVELVAARPAAGRLAPVLELEPAPRNGNGGAEAPPPSSHSRGPAR